MWDIFRKLGQIRGVGLMMLGFYRKVAVSFATVLSLASAHTIGLVGLVGKKHDRLDKCKGYEAFDVQRTDTSLRASLRLRAPCGIYGKDLEGLSLEVDYEDENRIHVIIQDIDKQRYQIPEAVFPRPGRNSDFDSCKNSLEFELQESPFSFSIVRKSTGEKLFDTANYPLVFANQYLRLKTALPKSPNIYGLGEHTDSFRLPTKNHTRTLWSRDSYGIPTGTNLYGNHPVYYEHRKSGTHGVLMLNSNGMDIKLEEKKGKASLEYNIIGGILDLYFFEGTAPEQAAREYAKIAGLPAMIPYWGLGCRYGYRDWIEVAEVIQNYTKAGIPLETMWTDIDYMYRRRVFTNDPERFPIHRLRQIAQNLHENDQKYIVMVDPAVAAVEGDQAYEKGVEMDVFLKEKSGKLHKGVVWPGVTVYPDWFDPQIGSYWDGEFQRFFNPETGVDIDGVWIDMNEPANFCNYPCADPAKEAEEQDMPPEPPAVRPNPDPPLPGYPNPSDSSSNTILEEIPSNLVERSEQDGLLAEEPAHYRMRRRNDENLLESPYKIQNAAGSLSNKTAATNVVHANGLTEYDVHNFYGTMMSSQTREAMLQRRPGLRPLIITRSTFAGAGRYVGKWLGDNLSTWDHYHRSISGMLNFASFFQMPYVGSDVGGFGNNVTETLLARWASLGAFNPFFRNHNNIDANPQEFYRFPLSTSAAKKAIKLRYSLLDYIYTAIYKQTLDGTPALSPLFFQFPEDEKTWAIEHQFFYGPFLLITPVLKENTTSVTAYFPEGIWYDFFTGKSFTSERSNRTLEPIPYDEIPVFVRSGSILALRHTVEGPDTTTALQKRDLDIYVALDIYGRANGEVYFDDGVSLDQEGEQTWVKFDYDAGKGVLNVKAEGVGREFGFGKVVVWGWELETHREAEVGLKVGESGEVKV